MNYKTVVLPRVNRILDRYPNYTSIDYFISDLDENTIQEILMWKGVTRQRRFFKLATFLYDQDVYTSQELKSWISIDTNQEHLLQIEGIGPKSIDYLSLLVGNSAIPIDRHLCNFAVMSGVTNTTYSYLSELYKQVCDFLRIEYHKLDCIIWNFMNSLLA
jgi:thermostable 8-oxoguanine DNA glycosylase